MELEILEKVLVNYQDSAIFVSDESSQQIIFFNGLCKDMFPEIREEMLVDDLFYAFSKKYDIITRNGMTYLAEKNNDLFSDQYFVSESKLTLDGDRQICFYVFHRVNFMYFYREFVSEVTARALLRDCEMSVIVNLNKNEYYITYEKGNDLSEPFGSIEHNWDSIVKEYLDEFVLPESAESFRDNMFTETLKNDYKGGTKYKNCVFSYCIDGERVNKKAMFDFVEYNGVPVVCIRFFQI